MNRIKSLRLENDLSQRDLAEKVGCSQKSIDYWEKGMSEPTAGFVCALADCFACTADYLLGREDDFGTVNVNCTLSEHSIGILTRFSKLSKENQAELLDFADFLVHKQSHTKK